MHEPVHKKTCFKAYEGRAGSHQTAHPWRLIRAFIVHISWNIWTKNMDSEKKCKKINIQVLYKLDYNFSIMLLLESRAESVWVKQLCCSQTKICRMQAYRIMTFMVILQYAPKYFFFSVKRSLLIKGEYFTL